MKYRLTIKPAIPPEQRHILEDELKKLGYHIISGGTMTDRSECDISFESTDKLTNKSERGESRSSAAT